MASYYVHRNALIPSDQPADYATDPNYVLVETLDHQSRKAPNLTHDLQAHQPTDAGNPTESR